MKKNVLILLPLLLILWSELTALSAEQHLREVDRLKGEGLYLSAWTYLHDHAEEIGFSAIMIRKAELCIRYYTVTNLHQMFAFDDLAPGETLGDVRRSRDGTGNMKLFDPEGGLTAALADDPENGALHYWLGEYYFSLLHLFGRESGHSEEELRHQIVSHYRSAVRLGEGRETLYANLAYTELTIRDWSSAILHFRAALEENPDNPAYHHNLAMALMQKEQLEEADREVRSALGLSRQAGPKADTLFLGSTIALMREDERAVLDYLGQGRQTAPRDSRFPDRLIRVHLVRQDTEKALENSRILFDLSPFGPESCQAIINHFHAFNALEDLPPFFTAQIPLYEDQPSILGNLLYHQGAVSLLTGKKEDARSQLSNAREVLSGVFPEDHQIFGIIDDLLRQADQTD